MRPTREITSRRATRLGTSASCQNRLYAGWSGTRCSRESSRARPQGGDSQSAGSSPAAVRSSSRNHSMENAPGTRGWLFSRNSPYGTRISPRSAIRLTFGRSSRASDSVVTAMKSPLSRTTSGPSIESHGVTAPAFPGRSVLICVPTAMNSSRMTIVAGWRPRDASPFARLFPYRSRSPPARLGWQRTGRPARMFSMNVSLGSRIAPLSALPTVPPFSSRYVSMNSQPSILRRRTCFWIFGALRQRPSAMTRHAPPRSRFVSNLGRSRCPLISTSSVPSPLIATGQFPAMRAISASVGWYWRCWTWRYSGISSLNRSTSCRLG